MRVVSSQFLLTVHEVKLIAEWIASNGFNLDGGHFELNYEFGSLGDALMLSFDSGAEVKHLEVFDGFGHERSPQTVDQIEIDGFMVPLLLSETVVEKYFEIARELTTAEVDEAIEPTGCGLTLKICADGCSVWAGNELIGIQS